MTPHTFDFVFVETVYCNFPDFQWFQNRVTGLL